MIKTTISISRFSVCSLLLFVTACKAPQAKQSADGSKTGSQIASADRSTSPTKESLEATAERIWTARKTRDCKTVAAYLDPVEYDKLTDKERFDVCDGDPFRYDRFKITKVEVEGHYGWVHVAYATRMIPFEKEAAQEVDTFEKWRFVDGQWYPVASRIQETCPESPGLRNAAREVDLKKRFEETWALRLSQDWNGLYEFVDPNDRDRVHQSDFVEAEGLIHYFDYELDWVQVMGDVGEVRVTYNNKLADPSLTRFPARKINLSEHYVLRNGVWYRDLVRAN